MEWKRNDQNKLLQNEPQDYGTMLENNEQKMKRKEESNEAHIFFLFKYTTKLDITLFILGFVFAMLSGALIPTLGLFFGGMTNAFISVAVNGLVPDDVTNNIISNVVSNAAPIEINYNRSHISNPKIHRYEKYELEKSRILKIWIFNIETFFLYFFTVTFTYILNILNCFIIPYYTSGQWHALFFEVYYTIIEVFETENPLDVLKNNNTYTVALTEHEFQETLNKYLIIYLIIGLLILLISSFQIWCSEYTSEHVVHQLRQLYFMQIMRQDTLRNDYNEKESSHDKFTENVEKIREGIGSKSVIIVQHFSTLVCGILVCLSVSWQLTLIILCIIPFLIGLSLYSWMLASQSKTGEQKNYAEAEAVTEEVLSNIKVVSAFGSQAREIKRFSYWLEAGRKMAIKKYNIFSVCLALTIFFTYGIYGAIFAYGSYLVRLGVISPGGVFTIFFCVVNGALAVNYSLPLLNTLSNSVGILTSVHKIINQKIEIDPYCNAGRRPSRLTGQIEFKDVSFSYSTTDQNQVLSGVSLKIEPGKQVAIVGSSGSGKSTIVNLILRFYDTVKGNIYVDDVSIKKYNVHWLRSQIGLLSHEPVLFGVSIGENIKYGFEYATYDDIVEAAKLVNAHDFIIKLPNGYQTLVGDSGLQLSVEQKQRIAFARALIRNPQILLIDEATKGLDPKSEEIVQKVLENVAKARTTIIIPHRLSAIRYADTIYVMQEGKLVEWGTHDELISKAGAYYELKNKQMGRGTFSDESRSDSNSETTLSETETNELQSPSFRSGKEQTEGIIEKFKTMRRSSGSSYASVDTSNDEIDEETSTPWKVLDRQVSKKTISDEDDDEYDTVITTIRETREILFDEKSENEEKHASTEKDVDNSISTINSNKPIGNKERKPYRRKYSTKTIEFTKEGRKDAFPLKPEKSDEEISFIKLLKMQTQDWPWLLIGLIGATGCGFILPIFVIYYGEIFRIFSLTGVAFLNASTFWSYMFAGFAIFCGLSYLFLIKGMTEANEKLLIRTRLLLFENILRQPVGWFDFYASSPKVLASNLTRNVSLIKEAAGLRLGQILSATLSLICFVIIGFIFGWKLMLALLFTIPIVIFLYFEQTQILNKNVNKDVNQMNAAERVASDAIKNIRTVRVLSQEKLFTKIYSTYLEEQYKEKKKYRFLYSLIYGVNQGITYLLYAVAFKLGGHLIETGEMRPEEMYKTFFAVSLCVSSVGITFSFIKDYTKIQNSIKLLNLFFKRQSEIDFDSSTGAKPEIEGKVEFKDVVFNYFLQPQVRILKGVKFTIKAEKTLALVGEPGCGKSTVISLLERFYDPIFGAILLDDFDIRTLNINYLRSKIGIVNQDSVLFDTTIKENIAYGAIALQNEVSFEQIEEAARTANIHEFIMSLPERYNTIVGVRGTQLPDDQKIKIAIARALIRNPKILLIDHVLSLDTESIKTVQDAIDKAKRGRTCLIATPLLSLIQNADLICVMDKGKIVESGTHEELHTLKGKYYKLIQRQILF